MKSFYFTLLFSIPILFANAQLPQSILELQSISKSEQNSNAWKLRGSTSRVIDNYDLKYHRCEWKVDPAVYYITGAVTSYFKPITDGFSEIDFDFASNMQIDSIIYHHTSMTFTHGSDDVLAIHLPGVIPNGMLDSVSVYYRAHRDKQGLVLFFKLHMVVFPVSLSSGLYRSHTVLKTGGPANKP